MRLGEWRCLPHFRPMRADENKRGRLARRLLYSPLRTDTLLTGSSRTIKDAAQHPVRLCARSSPDHPILSQPAPSAPKSLPRGRTLSLHTMRGALAIVALTTLASFGGPTLSAVSAAPAVAAVEPQHPFSSWSAPSASDSSSSERERVRLTLGVMSRCPDAVLVEALFDRVLERKTSLGGTGEGAGAEGGEGQGEMGTVAGLVDLRLEYIGE